MADRLCLSFQLEALAAALIHRLPRAMTSAVVLSGYGEWYPQKELIVSEPIDFASRTGNTDAVGDQDHTDSPQAVREPSNAVYARVGDLVLHSAIDGVRRGVQPEDIIREIRAKHSVHLTVGELRLLLATRRNPDAPNSRKSGMANRTPSSQE